MPPFDPSLPSIEEDPSSNRGTSYPRNNAKRPNRRQTRTRPRRNVASIANGSGGFLHPRDSSSSGAVPNNNLRKAPENSTMADAESTARLEAVAAAAAQEDEKRQQAQTTHSFRLPNIDAATASSASALRPTSDDPKLDPAGFFVHVNNTKFGDTASTAPLTHHPRVQYIFADDDPAVLSAALADAHTRNTASTSSARANPTREHGILVDVEPVTDPKTGKHTGEWRIASASSLSGDFAVTEAKMTRIDDSSSAAAVGGGGGSKSLKPGAEPDAGGTMMLKIDGVEMTDDDNGPGTDSLPGSQSADRSVSGDKEDYGALIEEFDKHMAMIKKIVAAGQTRAAKNAGVDEVRQPDTKKDLDGEESG